MLNDDSNAVGKNQCEANLVLVVRNSQKRAVWMEQEQEREGADEFYG
jgi:hypothetical protein